MASRRSHETLVLQQRKLPTMSEPRIRPLALCLFRHRGRILVNQGYDTIKGQSYFRPIGGGIEYGETGAEAVVREVREELGAEVSSIVRVGVFENIFTYNGRPGHEIVLIFDGRFCDEALYDRDLIVGVESDGEPFEARWHGSESFSAHTPLYPEGLSDLLRSLAGP